VVCNLDWAAGSDTWVFCHLFQLEQVPLSVLQLGSLAYFVEKKILIPGQVKKLLIEFSVLILYETTKP
jgi:hypothetical protein